MPGRSSTARAALHEGGAPESAAASPAGTTRAAQWRGGGVVFGPVPRSYEQGLPKKVRQAALRSALALRLRENAITVVDQIDLDAYSTRRMVEILKGLDLDEAGVLVVIEAANPMVERSARNLPRVKVLRAEGLNVYDVLAHPQLLISKAALGLVEDRLKKRKRGEGAASQGESA